MTTSTIDVPGVANAYLAKLVKYRKAMTGDVGAIDAVGEVFQTRADAAGSRTSVLAGHASAVLAHWNAPSADGFRATMADFSGQMQQLAAACSAAARAQWQSAEALRDAVVRMDDIIARFKADARAAAEAGNTSQQKCIAAAAASVQGMMRLESQCKKIRNDVQAAVKALGDTALRSAEVVEQDTDLALLECAATLNKAALRLNISVGARTFRSDFGAVNPWAPARSLQGLFGGDTQPYDLQSQFYVPATSAGYAAMAVPFSTTLGAKFRLNTDTVFIAGEEVAMTPGLALQQSGQGQPRSIASDIALGGALNPLNTNVYFSDNDTVNYLSTLGINSGAPAALDWASGTVSQWSQGKLALNSGLAVPTMAMIPATVNGFSQLSDLLVAGPSPTDTNNNRYWAAVLSRSAALGLGVTVPVSLEQFVQQASTGKKLDWATAGLALGLPFVQSVGSEVLLGPEPPDKSDLVWSVPHNTGRWVAADIGALNYYLLSSEGPGDGSSADLLHAGTRGGKAVLDLALSGMLPGTSETAIDDAARTIDGQQRALYDAMHQPQLSLHDRAVSALLNSAAGTGHTINGVAQTLFYPAAYANGTDAALRDSIQQEFGAAGQSFQRVLGGWDAYETPGTPNLSLAPAVPALTEDVHDISTEFRYLDPSSGYVFPRRL
ncbi:hypothetical protein ACQP2F_15630 [Actinoplanes sp. CA-030573]|uniref:hypothetical protein n=1 Tax=Actinoplanes sp. CA-030573 TaxID=3239898 RepID=UPI003D8F97C7